MKTKLIGIIICMLLVGTVLPVSGTVIIDNTTSFNVSGNTLYVGGSGEGNYTSIQDAIDNASDEDTVFVYDDSSPYYENVVVNKSIFLIGENRDTTVIDGNWSGDVVYISADRVTVSGFTIQNGGRDGIYLKYSKSNTITGNTISNNVWIGIFLKYSSINTITGNNISNNFFGIYLDNSNSNTITGNTITNNGYGIKLSDSSGITITGNNISNNEDGISIVYNSSSNIIYHNNFVNNTQNAYDECNNTWDDGKYGNYWSDYKEKYPNAKKKWLKGIWDTPYEIPDGNNKDRCPLIKQWPNLKPRTIPRNTALNSFYLLRFLEQFPNLFPILRHLLRL